MFCLGSVLFIGVFSWWIISAGLPYVSKLIAHQLPASFSEALGEQLLDIVDYAGLEETGLSQDRRQQVTRLFTEVIDNSGLQDQHC